MAKPSSSATTLQINDLSKQIEKPLRKLTYNELEAFKNDGVACLKQVLPTKWVNEFLALTLNKEFILDGTLGSIGARCLRKKTKDRNPYAIGSNFV